MNDLIYRSAAIKLLRGEAVAKYPNSFCLGLFAAADEVNKLPAVDAVEVVRFKECKHYGNAEGCKPICRKFEGLYGYPNTDDFCSYGERRER